MLYQNVIVNEYEAGLFYRNGKFVRTLPAGRWRAWTAFGRGERITKVDMRLSALAVNGQEMLTADKVTLRLNLSAAYRVSDAARSVNTVQNAALALYTELQLALRALVTGLELDALMADRDALAADLLVRVRPAAAALGLTLETVGVRDIILPGEVKKMLARGAEALREGQAALVAAREETAAVRAALNTARMLTENPVLLHLRGLKSLETVAESGNTIVVTLPGGLSDLLAPSRQSGVSAGGGSPDERGD